MPNDLAYEALKLLVMLKEEKEQHGETVRYLERKASAWKAAKDIVHQREAMAKNLTHPENV